METKATTVEYYPVIVELETNGTWSAYVAGLPGVYAAADTATDAKRAIRGALAAHLNTVFVIDHKPIVGFIILK